jgi:hypothetical protein
VIYLDRDLLSTAMLRVRSNGGTEAMASIAFMMRLIRSSSPSIRSYSSAIASSDRLATRGESCKETVRLSCIEHVGLQNRAIGGREPTLRERRQRAPQYDENGNRKADRDIPRNIKVSRDGGCYGCRRCSSDGQLYYSYKGRVTSPTIRGRGLPKMAPGC